MKCDQPPCIRCEKARVLIGPVSLDPAESVSLVNQCFINGLTDRYSFSALGADRSLGNTRQSRLNAINAFYFFRQLVQWLVVLVKDRPQIAHYAISSGWAMEKGLLFTGVARAFGAKTIGHVHSGSFLTFWDSLSQSRKKRAWSQLAKFDAIILLSDEWRANFARRVGLPADKLFVVNNPIEAEFEDAALQFPIESRSNSILSLGIMGRPKGVMEMVEAAVGIPSSVPFEVCIAGPEREPGILRDVQQLIATQNLSDRFELKSSVWGKEKLRLYREASIFVLPSHYENFPLVILEAAAGGLAIITTPVGAVPEFFQDGISALFVEPRNPKQLAQALTMLLQNPGERMRLAGAARDMFISRLARPRIMESLDAVYRQVLHN